MKIISLPGKLSCYKLVSGGAIGLVFCLNDRIVLKYARDDGDSAAFARENELYDLFEQQETYCPSIIHSFLRLPSCNFLANMSGGSLFDRLRSNQVRDASFYGRVFSVEKTEPEERVALWLRELTGAVVWLASLGLVHGDLQPTNILLDGQQHLKLADFDCVEKWGEPSSGNRPPWARVLGDDADAVDEPEAQWGSFGNCGTRTEQFAIGSNVYSMLYGMEPYEDRERGQTPSEVDMLRDRQFPPLQSRPLDAVIAKCWNAEYARLQDLLDEAVALSPQPGVADLSEEYIENCRGECQALIDGGLFIKEKKKPSGDIPGQGLESA